MKNFHRTKICLAANGNVTFFESEKDDAPIYGSVVNINELRLSRVHRDFVIGRCGNSTRGYTDLSIADNYDITIKFSFKNETNKSNATFIGRSADSTILFDIIVHTSEENSTAEMKLVIDEGAHFDVSSRVLQ